MQNNPPSPPHNVGQTWNDPTAAKVEQHWKEGGGSFRVLRILQLQCQFDLGWAKILQSMSLLLQPIVANMPGKALLSSQTAREATFFSKNPANSPSPFHLLS